MNSYQMKDLGYERTPTADRLFVAFSDGSVWSVPVQVIADSRDKCYREEREDTIGFIRDGSLFNGEIEDWATSNMDWSDVQEWAVRLPTSEKPVNYEREWVGAKKDVSTKAVEKP